MHVHLSKTPVPALTALNYISCLREPWPISFSFALTSQAAFSCLCGQVVDESCPRYVMMGRPQHGLGHQMGTFTTALITALYFNLTLVDSGFRDDSTSPPPGAHRHTNETNGRWQGARLS
jgi:hypothetical protein